MNKSESKYFNTALCMDEALISLLETKDLEQITVKEICKKAGVNRSTFYLHYETISDLVNETAETVNNRFRSYFTNVSDNFTEQLHNKNLNELVFITEDYLRPYLKFIKENKKVYRAAFRNPNEANTQIRYKNLKRCIIEPVLKRFKISDPLREYYTVYYLEGIAAIIREWLNGNCSDSIETMISVIEACVRPQNITKGKADEK